MTDTTIRIDPNIDGWTVIEARAFRKAVGVNPEYAWACLGDAFVAAENDAREAFGDRSDEDGWEPPEGWLPMSLLNLDQDYLLGLAWIPARRDDPGLAYDDFAASLKYGDLVAGFWEAVTSAAEEADPLPQPSRAERRRKSPAKKPSSPSASSTGGRRTTSTGSPSAESQEQSATPTST